MLRRECSGCCVLFQDSEVSHFKDLSQCFYVSSHTANLMCLTYICFVVIILRSNRLISS